jgi:hypothetical protein
LAGTPAKSVTRYEMVHRRLRWSMNAGLVPQRADPTEALIGSPSSDQQNSSPSR